MDLQKKAQLNLFFYQKEDDSNAPSFLKKDWRMLSLKDVEEELLASDIHLTIEEFEALAADYDSPEEFFIQFVQKEDDRLFLTFFELWRRYIPDRPTLSIFCDELDYRIYLYETEQLENDESIQDIIEQLLVLLDENVDAGESPEMLLILVSHYCAHNIESFICDYIYEQIEANNQVYASELIEDFYPYFSDVKWLDLLQVLILFSIDVDRANELLHKLYKEICKTPDKCFQMAVLHFLTKAGDRNLFFKFVKKTLPLITTQNELSDLLSLVASFFRFLDHEEKEKKIKQLLERFSTTTFPLSTEEQDAVERLLI